MSSDKQREACIRNHTIMRLRGAYQLFHQLGNISGKISADEEIKRLGGEPEGIRRERWRKEIEDEYRTTKG